MKRSTSSGEQLGTGLSELHIGPGFVHPQPAARDGELKTGAIFGRAAAMREQERPVDFLNVNASVLDGLNGAGDFQQLTGGLLGISKWSIGGELHLACCPACDGSFSPRAHIEY